MSDAALREFVSRALAVQAGPESTHEEVSDQLQLRGASLADALVPLLGEEAVNAVFSRALIVTAQQRPWLVTAHKADDSTAMLAQFASLLDQRPKADATDAATRFLVELVELLMTFIGEATTMRLLTATWPDRRADAGEGQLR